MMTAKVVVAKFQVFDLFSPIERREGLEMRTFVEILTGLITGANNSSGGALSVIVESGATFLTIACRSRR